MAKLTLGVDDRVVARAKLYAKRQGVSVSKMVEAYLSSVADVPVPSAAKATPVLRSVRGILKNADIDEYRRHLSTKYRGAEFSSIRTSYSTFCWTGSPTLLPVPQSGPW
jgi:hypothetical protein